MFLSIIVPYYACGAYVYTCLKSISEGVNKANYLNLDIEILVIDDFNDEENTKLLEGALYAIDDAKIRVIRPSQNLGLCDARNLGVSEAKGEYIFFIDADDYINSDTFVNILHTLKSVKTDIIFFDSHTFKNEHTWNRMWQFSFHPRSIQQVNEENISRYMRDSTFYVWRFIVKHEIVSNIKFHTRLYMEDVATSPVILAKCKNLWYEPISVVNYRVRPNSIMTAWNPKKITDMVLAPALAYQHLDEQYVNVGAIKNERDIMGYRFFYWAIQDARVLNKNIDKEFYLQIKNLYIEHFGKLDIHKELPLLKQIYTEKHEIIKWLLLYYNWSLFKNMVTPKGNFRFKAFRKRIYHTMILVWRILVPTIIIVFIILNIYQLLK